jgi:hypothetical protein
LVISLNLVLAGLRLGLKNRQVGEKWVADDCSGAPSGTGYTKIYSSGGAFAALKADGSITAWGSSDAGGTGAPSGIPS